MVPQWKHMENNTFWNTSNEGFNLSCQSCSSSGTDPAEISPKIGDPDFSSVVTHVKPLPFRSKDENTQHVGTYLYPPKLLS